MNDNKEITKEDLISVIMSDIDAVDSIDDTNITFYFKNYNDFGVVYKNKQILCGSGGIESHNVCETKEETILNLVKFYNLV